MSEEARNKQHHGWRWSFEWVPALWITTPLIRDPMEMYNALVGRLRTQPRQCSRFSLLATDYLRIALASRILLSELGLFFSEFVLGLSWGITENLLFENEVTEEDEDPSIFDPILPKNKLMDNRFKSSKEAIGIITTAALATFINYPMRKYIAIQTLKYAINSKEKSGAVTLTMDRWWDNGAILVVLQRVIEIIFNSFWCYVPLGHLIAYGSLPKNDSSSDFFLGDSDDDSSHRSVLSIIRHTFGLVAEDVVTWGLMLTFTMPLKVIWYNLLRDCDKSVFKGSILKCIKIILQEEGWKGFFNGLGGSFKATLPLIILHCGANFLISCFYGVPQGRTRPI